ncbi:hypothetical protein Tco_1501557 [Tanacetum coccineum]
MHKDGDRQGMFTSLGRTQPTSLSIPLESGPYVTPKTVHLTYINATCDNEFVVAIQGVPIDVPIDGIDMGKYKAVLNGRTIEKRKVVMDEIFSMWDRILAVNPNISLKPNSYDNASRGLLSIEVSFAHAIVLGVARGFDYVNSDSESSSEELIRVTPGVISHIDEIVQSVSIQDKPISYVGVTGGLKPEPSKSKANFQILSFRKFV